MAERAGCCQHLPMDFGGRQQRGKAQPRGAYASIPRNVEPDVIDVADIVDRLNLTVDRQQMSQTCHDIPPAPVGDEVVRS